MSDFLLELRCEEIPARMQASARAELEKLFRRELQAENVSFENLTVWSTPRRLALIARGLPEETEGHAIEAKGPRVGAPDQAIDGFLRRYDAKREELTEQAGIYFLKRLVAGRPMFRVLQDTVDTVINDFSWPKSMRWGAASLSTESVRWVRPLSGIVAILGEDLVECEVGGVASGYATLGHRFHHDGPITIGGADDYQEKLRACHVIVDHEEREGIVREMSRAAALAEGLTLIEDEGLVIENAGLTEWPVPLLGRFEAAFLDVPPEVIQLTARTNQKYFVCDDPEDKLANAFVCTANIAPADGGEAIVDGNRKVLAARLSDARFFWEQDRKTPLADHAKKLQRITFHEKLGTVADKVERVAKLARWLVEEGIVKSSPSPTGRGTSEAGGGVSSSAAKLTPPPSSGRSPSPSELGEDRVRLADLAEQAARLAKADLVTEMVGEFPELQGVMGGYYARAEGLPDAVADAIRDHYKPVGQGDEVPTAPVTVAVSLADKLDTLAGFFALGATPTGSKDPFALRRAAIAVIGLLVENNLRLHLKSLEFFLLNNLLDGFKTDHEIAQRRETLDWLADVAEIKPKDGFGEYQIAEIRGEVEGPLDVGYMHVLLDFFADRLKVQQREGGVRHDLIDAVFALGGEDDLVRLLARVHALQAFMSTEDGANLLAGYKRAANILKKEDWKPAAGRIPRTGEEDPLAMVDDPDLAAVVRARVDMQKQLSYTPEPAEEALIAALDSAEPTAAAAVEAEDFAAAMGSLATLRAPIDTFFDSVTVNDADPARREARLTLLARFRDAVHRVADFSRIEG